MSRPKPKPSSPNVLDNGDFLPALKVEGFPVLPAQKVFEMTEISLPLPRSRLNIQGFEVNSGASPVTIALHGWLDNCYSFKPISEVLSDTHLLAIDLPGHGDSDHLPAGRNYEFHDYLIWLHEIVLTLNVKPIRLIGHSMGAGIASLYAGMFPEYVESLVLVEGLGPLSIAEDEAPRRMRQHIESWVNRVNDLNSVFNSLDHAIQTRKKIGSLALESAMLLAERGTRAQGEGVVWKHDPRLKLPSRFPFSQAQVLSFLRCIQCPTLLIQSQNSTVSRALVVQERIEAISQLTHIMVEGGHHVHLDEYEGIGKIIEDFLTKRA